MENKKSKKFITLCKKYGVDPDNIANEVLSFEDACKIKGENPKHLPLVGKISERHRKRIIVDYKLSIIAEALRSDKTADYTNSSEVKYCPYFQVKADKKRPSGFGLSYGGCVVWYSDSTVGVRLCFENRDTEIFFGKHFIKLHEEHQLYI